MSKRINAIRGMNDMLPNEAGYWHLLESNLRSLTSAFGYGEIRFPIVEQTALFKRSIGDVTDIVEKEMYTFEDRNNDSLTLRPEGTASCVRAGIEHGLLHNQTQRFWYLGPMFRHEKPQKGRYRQFYQFGLEAFGWDSADSDVEIILFSHQLWQKLGLLDKLSLEINTIGTKACRTAYAQALVDYFQAHKEQLDNDSLRRLDSNPLRLLDSKLPEIQSLIREAPKFADYQSDEAKSRFASVCQLLDGLGIQYHLNPKLVRGLDYYGHTVFEWTTSALGSQGAVCAGGRYDGLVEHLGGKSAPAVGFAMGLERIVLLLQQQQDEQSVRETPDLFFAPVGAVAQGQVLQLAKQLNEASPATQFVLGLGDKKLKAQLKAADKSQAAWAVILGENEIAQGFALLKPLFGQQEQQVEVPLVSFTQDVLKLLNR